MEWWSIDFPDSTIHHFTTPILQSKRLLLGGARIYLKLIQRRIRLANQREAKFNIGPRLAG
jgi:hypothetical protein